MIAEVKSRLSVIDCLEHFGVTVPPRDRQVIMTHCPFHDDKTPSFAVYRRDNRAWCHACQKGGDVIDITRLLLNSSISEAVAYWKDRLGLAAHHQAVSGRPQPTEEQKLQKLRDYVQRRSIDLERFTVPKEPAIEPYLVYVYGEKDELDLNFRKAATQKELLEYLSALERWHGWAENLLGSAPNLLLAFSCSLASDIRAQVNPIETEESRLQKAMAERRDDSCPSQLRN